MSPPPDGVKVGDVLFLWPLSKPGRPDRNADKARFRGAVVFHRWLESHLPVPMVLPAVFPGDGLLDKVPGWGDWSERSTGECEPDPTNLAVVASLDGRDRTGDCRMLAPETIAKAAADANRRVTAGSMAAAYFRLATARLHQDRENADAVLAYLSQHPRGEARVREAAGIIKRVLRAHGRDYPPAVADYTRPARRPSDRIRDAFMRAACNALEGRMPIVSATGRADGGGSGDDGATLIARAFGMGEDGAATVARTGIKYRHDREFLT